MSKPRWPRKHAKHYKIPLFPGDLYAFYEREHFDAALLAMNVEKTDPNEHFGGLAMALEEGDFGNRIYLVGIFDWYPSVCCHEAVHACQYICEHVGASDNETEAYLAQAIFDHLYDHLPELPKESTDEAKGV